MRSVTEDMIFNDSGSYRMSQK